MTGRLIHRSWSDEVAMYQQGRGIQNESPPLFMPLFVASLPVQFFFSGHSRRHLSDIV